MNELYLKSYTEKEIIYEYQPEGKGTKGIIVYSFDDNIATINKIADNDNDKYYARMAVNAITNIAQKNSIPKFYTQAWY